MEGSTEAKVGICRGEPSSKTLGTVPGTQKVPGELATVTFPHVLS